MREEAREKSCRYIEQYAPGELEIVLPSHLPPTPIKSDPLQKNTGIS